MTDIYYPKISIITPVFNNVKYIEKCILSVLNQNYPNLEYIIIDGGSTDGTVQIIEKYKERLSYFISEKDRGQSHALNKGFEKATGDVFGWLNADEEYMPETLYKVEEAFVKTTDLDFFYGQRIIVDKEKKEIGRAMWPSMHPKWHLLYRMWVLPTDASFYRAHIHKLTGELDVDNFPSLGMDVDWFLRLSVNVKKWKCTKSFLSKFTEREDRATIVAANKDSTRSLKNHHMAREKYFRKYPHSKIKLWLGWAFTGLWYRIITKRLNIYDLIKALKNGGKLFEKIKVKKSFE